MIYKLFLTVSCLMIFYSSAVTQSKKFIEINPNDGIITFFPESPENDQFSRVKYPGKEIYLDGLRMDNKTQQIRIMASPQDRSIISQVQFYYPFDFASATWNMDVNQQGNIVSASIPWNAMLIGERLDPDEGEEESLEVREKLKLAENIMPGLPIIYSSGNSISLGYWPYLEKELWHEANIYYQREMWKDMPETRSPNNGHAHNAYKSLQKAYLNTNFKPDYILLNFGLHMINSYHNNLEGYGDWVQKFIDLAIEHDCKIIWVTTTPYALFRKDKNVTVQSFNTRAKKVIKKNEMFIIDLYAFIKELVNEKNEWNIYTDGVHFKEDIKAKQGEFIGKEIRQILK